MTGVYIGVDASWTACAVTALEVGASGLQVRRSEVLSTKPGDFSCRSERLERMGENFRTLIGWMRQTEVRTATHVLPGPEQVATVAIEGYAMKAKYRPQMAGELAGHLKLVLWKMGLTYIIVPPNTLKTYVMGKCGAKNLMMMWVFKRWGYEAKNDDENDAYALARIAHEYAKGEWTKKFTALIAKCEVVEAKDKVDTTSVGVLRVVTEG